MKTCKSCGEEKTREEFYRLRSPKYKDEWDCRDSLCIPCRIKYHTERRREVKKKAIEYKGGKCEDCGCTGHPAVFDFHHLDPTKKDFSIGKSTKRFETIQLELDNVFYSALIATDYDILTKQSSAFKELRVHRICLPYGNSYRHRGNDLECLL